METLNYEIHIKASIQKVWDILWNPETYPIWTQFFAPNSQMKSDWKIGGKTYFTDLSGDAMVSTIESIDEPNEIIFRHLGMIKNGIEDTSSKDVKVWSGAEEKYFLSVIDENTTELRVVTHVGGDYKETMNKGLKPSFTMLKNLAENP